MIRNLTQSALTVSVLCLAPLASAGTAYSFTGVSNNNVNDTQIAESQMVLEVSESGGHVLFEFSNLGPEQSSMVQLYWDDKAGVLDEMVGWDTTTPSGVKYDGGGASPGNLPAGNTIDFDADYSIDPKNKGGKVNNGIGEYEDLTVRFSMVGGFDQVINAMNSGLLRVGIHVQGYCSGGSESLVTGASVPTPTAALGGLTLLGLAAARRRRK